MALRAMILRELSHEGPLSRAQLARRLKVSPSRISETSSKLLEEGVICTVGFGQELGRGRKSVLLDLDCSYKFAVGVSIYGRFVCAGLTTVKGEVLGQIKQDFEKQEDACGAVISSIAHLLNDSSIGFDRIIGVGLCAKAATDLTLLDKLEKEFDEKGVPFLFEPWDEYLRYSRQYLPISRDGMFMFGCAKVIRDVFIGN